MATGNFHNKNASMVFSFCISETDEFQNEMEYEDTIDNVRYELSNIAEKSKDIYETRLRVYTCLHSYPSKSIISIAKDVIIGDVDARIIITAIARSGYYDGVNLDWEMEIELCSTNFDTIEDITLNEWMDETYRGSNMNAGLRKMQYPIFIKRMKLAQKELVDIIENTYKEYTTTLGIFASFSNGEVIYQNA